MRHLVSFRRHCEERSDDVIQKLRSRLDCFALLAMTTIGFALAMAVSAAQARDFEMGGDTDYPYSIMKPEPGTTAHHRAATTTTEPVRRSHPSLPGHEKFVGKLHRRPGMFTSHGSSGSVLPTPLPRTGLIPPEGGGMPITHALPQEQGPSIVLGVGNPVPNLPHGPETFQDRASRCVFQSGLYNVPGSARSQYIGGCVQ